ncbi:fungal-specific transcription factor domain-containing protein [Aspergillus granulosus]|uniref:Fungal-specific transcription factor domain-containing protein n=1 Tax=Aspergillus granulosus TaxID=176169 RepID=A0ABR4GY98_9EURO
MAELRPNDSAYLPKERKRTRVQLSCTACRNRKLKCCRTHPCTNCIKRGEGHMCTFVGRGPRGRSSHGRASPTLVQDRLQHLENLIMSFAQQRRQDDNQVQDSSPVPPAPDLDPRVLPSPPKAEGMDAESRESPASQSGRLLVNDKGTNYIDSAHWKAILEEINEFKESLNESDDVTDDELSEEDDTSEFAPVLWFGLTRPTSIEELLVDLPSRQVTDRLIHYFLNSEEPVTTILHGPTFGREYTKFWSNPQDVSLPWLAILYSIMTLSVLFYQRTGDRIPDLPGDSKVIAGTFRKRSVQCLVQSNYLTPGQYKVEAMFLYSMGEFYKSRDAHTEVPYLLGLTIKLAMRMGYHRDSQQFPAISAFDGEMRRRVWAFLCQLDALFAFEVGVPRTIQDWQYDTELPRNLGDADFDQDTVKLPPSRPLTEMTQSTYTIAKARLMLCFGKILDMAFSRIPITYEETLEVDRRLDEAHSLIPQMFKIRPISQSLPDPPRLIFQRFTLENVYQKARCVLHRKYLAEAHANKRYWFSRMVCITASKQILRVHADLYNETQPGGLLDRNRLFPNSIQYTDYLLAAMILCMELSYSHSTRSVEMAGNDDFGGVVGDREGIISTLEHSHQILENLRRESADAQKAHAALTIMLRRVGGGVHTILPPKAALQSPATHVTSTEPVSSGFIRPISQEQANQDIAGPPPYGSLPNLVASNFPNLETPLYQADPTTTFMPVPMAPVEEPYASLDVIGDMLETPANINWQIWDQHIQNPTLSAHNNDMWYH